MFCEQRAKCPLVLDVEPLNKGFIIPSLFQFLEFWLLFFEIYPHASCL